MNVQKVFTTPWLYMIIIAAGIIVTMLMQDSQNVDTNTNITPNTNSTAVSSVEKALCDQTDRFFYLQRCETVAGETYYAILSDKNRIADAGDGIYDAAGAFVVGCGGLVPAEVAEERAPLCERYDRRDCSPVQCP